MQRRITPKPTKQPLGNWPQTFFGPTPCFFHVETCGNCGRASGFRPRGAKRARSCGVMDAPHEILDTRNCHNLKGDIYIYVSKAHQFWYQLVKFRGVVLVEFWFEADGSQDKKSPKE